MNRNYLRRELTLIGGLVLVVAVALGFGRFGLRAYTRDRQQAHLRSSLPKLREELCLQRQILVSAILLTNKPWAPILQITSCNRNLCLLMRLRINSCMKCSAPCIPPPGRVLRRTTFPPSANQIWIFSLTWGTSKTRRRRLRWPGHS